MIERFIAEYSERAYQCAYHFCGNADEAKELVQEAFFRAIRRWEQYDASQPLENWFLTILRNLYYDGLKRFERRGVVSLDAPRDAEAGDEGEAFGDVMADEREGELLARLEREESAQDVRAALEALSPEHRAILTLCDVQGLGYHELTQVLDCPLGTVRSRLSRARSALKRKLLEQEVLES